jgi:hypothetical protein
VYVRDNSSLQILDGTSNGFIDARKFSTVLIRGEASVIGSVWLSGYSDLDSGTVEPIQGQVECVSPRNRARCDPYPAGGIHNCD